MGTTVRLFGPPVVIDEDARHELPSGKTSGLLCFVAYQGGWVQRQKLLPLLWPESDESTARNNLRQMLYGIRSEPYAHALEIETNRLRWLADTDVAAFRAAEGKDDARVVAAYGGPLLAGFHVSDAPEFTTWLEFEREDLHHRFRRSALRLTEDAHTDPEPALRALDEVLAADPFDEDVIRASLRLRHRVHGPADALRLFQRFANRLDDELGAEPDRATLALVDEIRAPESAMPPNAIRVGTPRIVSLPKPLTRFVGRADELARLTRVLVDPGTRLVTVRAPGGMGKTRLAIEAASLAADDYEGPVVFVPLAEQRHPEDILREVALALGIAEPTGESPATAVGAALRGRTSLLVLDNLEQIPGAGRTVAALLESAPGLTVLATSRTVLGVLGEHVFDLKGLRVRSGAGDPHGHTESAGDAVDLFLHAAQRIQGHDEIDGASLDEVARVCRITGGMPLALELAANWTRVFSVAEIAEQLEGGLDLLERPQGGAEARHASVRTVIAHSWTDLDAAQRKAMMALSVLRGPFTRAEAFEVAGVGHRRLLELVDRSFLDVLGAGRFGRHPMIDAFVRERAAEHDELVAPARDRHVSYFAEQLARMSEGVFRPGEDELLLQVSAMKENARAAWDHAVRAERWDLLDSMMPALNRYHDTRDQRALFAGMVENALRATPPEAPIWAALIQLLVHHLRQIGRSDDALRVAEAALPHLRRHGPPKRQTALMRTIGTMSIERGDHDAARAILEEALAVPGVSEAPGVHARLLGNLFLITDDVGEQAGLLEEAVAIARLHDSPVTLGVMLRIASSQATVLGRFEEAVDAAEEALSVVSGIDDAGRVRPLVEVAFTRMNVGHLDAAERAVEEAERIAPRVPSGWREEADAWIAFLDILLALARDRDPDAIHRLERGRGESAPFLWWVAARAYVDTHRNDDARRAIEHLRAHVDRDPYLRRRAGLTATADLLESELLFRAGSVDAAKGLVKTALERAVDRRLAPIAADALLMAARLVDAEAANSWPELVAGNPAATHLTRKRARQEWDLPGREETSADSSPDAVERYRLALLDAAAHAAELISHLERR